MRESDIKLNFQFFDCEIQSQNLTKVQSQVQSKVRVLIIYNLDGIVALSVCIQSTANQFYLERQEQILDDYQSCFEIEERRDEMIEKTLRKYFNSSNRNISSTLKINWDLIQATEFQKKVWRKMCEVSFGLSKSYQQIAKMVGSPKGQRAIGGACGANPLMLLIPCHRIISSSGALGGFSSGSDLKKILLAIEGIEVKQS